MGIILRPTSFSVATCLGCRASNASITTSGPPGCLSSARKRQIQTNMPRVNLSWTNCPVFLFVFDWSLVNTYVTMARRYGVMTSLRERKSIKEMGVASCQTHCTNQLYLQRYIDDNSVQYAESIMIVLSGGHQFLKHTQDGSQFVASQDGIDTS